jgi:hypothetical protein
LGFFLADRLEQAGRALVVPAGAASSQAAGRVVWAKSHCNYALVQKR